jgi:hypothetical protein
MAGKTVNELLSEVRTKRAELEAEIAKLEAVESYLCAAVNGSDAENIKGPARQRTAGLRGLTKAEAVERVLRESPRPMKIGELIDALASEGLGTHLKRSVQHNSLYTTMTRKPEIFLKNEKSEWTVKPAAGKRID